MELRKPHVTSEDEYFYQLNRQLIDRQRHYLNQIRKNKEALSQQKLHWMKCPKCGVEMDEQELAGVVIDHCGNCKGIYLDKGELELILSSQEPDSFFRKLKHFFSTSGYKSIL